MAATPVRDIDVAMVLAVDLNGAIGKDGKLPWGRMPSDMAHFKEITRGKPLIMGRKTFESLNGHDLGDGRTMIVVTSDTKRGKYMQLGAFSASSLLDAIGIGRYFATIGGVQEICVIGGSRLYTEALPFCHKIYLTKIHTHVEGADTWFNEFNLLLTEVSEGKWISKERHKEAGNDDAHDVTFVTLLRSPSAK